MASTQQPHGSAARILQPRQASGGSRQLLDDARIAVLFAEEARYRTVARLLGVPREQANLASFVLLLVLARALHDATGRLRAAGTPGVSDGLLGGAALRELLYLVAGPSARDTPFLGTLLTLAVLGGAARRVLTRSRRTVRSSSQRANAGFHHRYGYLVDPGHRRANRASRRFAEASTPPPAS